MDRTDRIYSFDALRAIMMLLGIGLHSTEIYLVQDNAPFPKDPRATHIFLDYLEYLIHMFRMPVFFLIAGFFGSMLFYERQPLKMIKNRVSRIVFPFIVFLFILSPIIVFSLHFTNSVFAGNQNAFGESLASFSGIELFIPDSTYHLWFLYYLILITASTVLLALVLKKLPSITGKITRSFNWVMNKPVLRLIFFAFLHFIVLLIIWDLSGGTPLGFKPEFEPFLFYSFFYLVGWILYKSKHVLGSLKQHDLIFTILALILFTIRFVYADDLGDVEIGLMHALIVWLFVFGLTGLFVRYFSSNSARMRYISDSSYWVYLIHLPLTLIIPGLISDWPLQAISKFLIVLITTTIICFVSYHYLVRSTFIGKFLNGRKY